ncbi:MAG: 1-acyl-sn-glycerol-3-phosphate acyltransferase, partial [Rhodocyclales bacterium]|nr:1-acyl-sn-glycerol-3-phosphate acyltransferase [Rhodocyclales bacterium]
MTETLSVPLWLFAPMAALAGWALLVLFLVPGMRWFLRRKISSALRQIGSKLQVELPAFKLTRRQVLIDRLFHDPAVQAAAEAYAKEHEEPLGAVWARVDRYAREIVPAFNAYFYFRIGYALARTIARSLYRVRIGYVDDAALARLNPKSTIVFVINHRSNMDYVLVAFLAAERTALSYAVGEWARVWPLQQIIRATGAYFVRRNSGDPLYRTVLARYVRMASEAGVTQAVFPEGGLTVDGRLRPPRFGLFDYMTRGFNVHAGRDLVFIPVGINYDRVLEDRSQLLKLHPEQPRPGKARGVANTLLFVVENLRLMLSGRWHRFGYACVNFGTPLSLRAYMQERQLSFAELDDARRQEVVTALARHLMGEIGRVIPVLPVPLVASIVVAAPERRWSELEIKAAALERAAELE